jgi:hypothetical protein
MNHSKRTLEIAAIVIVVALSGVALAVPQQALANRPHNLFAIGPHGTNVHGADGKKGLNVLRVLASRVLVAMLLRALMEIMIMA